MNLTDARIAWRNDTAKDVLAKANRLLPISREELEMAAMLAAHPAWRHDQKQSSKAR